MATQKLTTALVIFILAFMVKPSAGAPTPAKANVRLPRDASSKTLRPTVPPPDRRATSIGEDTLNKLIAYGYLPIPERGTVVRHSESQLTDAIRRFQRYASIPETGVMDEPTRKQFAEPRCSMADVQPQADDNQHQHRHKRYASLGGRWNKTDLTWTVASHPTDLNSTMVHQDFARAFNIWANDSVFTFRYVVHSSDADIIISFEKFDNQGIGWGSHLLRFLAAVATHVSTRPKDGSSDKRMKRSLLISGCSLSQPTSSATRSGSGTPRRAR